MVTDIIANSTNTFRIKRPLITTNGFVSETDETVQEHLVELNELLGKPIFKPEMFHVDSPENLAVVIAEGFDQLAEGVDQLAEEIEDLPDAMMDEVEEREQDAQPSRTGGLGARAEAGEVSSAAEASAEASAAAQAAAERGASSPLRTLLGRPLTPKRIPDNTWKNDSLLHFLRKSPEPVDGKTLTDCMEITPELSALKYGFESNLSSLWLNLDFNTKAVLEDYPAIRDYLVARAYFVMGARDVNGVKNFIFSNQGGAKSIVTYTTISAARAIIHREKHFVPDYNVDDSETGIVSVIKKTPNLSLSAVSFGPTIRNVIKNFLPSDRELGLIKDFERKGFGKIPENLKPQLIHAIRYSVVPIKSGNVQLFLPQFIAQIAGTTQPMMLVQENREVSDQDFTVEYFQDDTSQIQVSKSAVKCAAQLYYSMVLGDELEMFNVANYFTHKYLLRGGIDIDDHELRSDLQMYVFSNRYGKLKPDPTRLNKFLITEVKDRTRPAERQMFYRQVFGYGNAQITDDLLVNTEFPRLWKVLILESAKYLERAQSSFNPDSYVSRQNVMQAVEDIQYNLSTHCMGMANVITPMIYEELDFVTKRIFMHEKVLDIVPTGGTWWRLVETLYQEMKHTSPKATVIYNKAKLGHAIIRSIAEYNPASFEDDKSFSAFISNVDAFITTQSILQEALTDSLKQDQEYEPSLNGYNQNGYNQDGYYQDGYYHPSRESGGKPIPTGAQNGSDEWDF